MSALAFTLLALALVGPVPAVLARASWPMRAPRAAVVLWCKYLLLEAKGFVLEVGVREG